MKVSLKTIAICVVLISAILAVSGGISPPLAYAVTTFTVTTTADSGAGSLRQAIDDANGAANSGGPDVIEFTIAGTGVHTITPVTSLPSITDPVLIDGYSQPGAMVNTFDNTQGTNAVLKIELNGTSAGGPGLLITGGGAR